MSIGWDSLSIGYDCYPVETLSWVTSKQHYIAVFTVTDIPSSAITDRYIGGCFKREEAVLCICLIVPANTSQYTEWDKESGAMTIAIAVHCIWKRPVEYS